MKIAIDLRLYATLQKYTPAQADQYPIEPGMRLAELVSRLGIPLAQSKLFFVNGRKGDPETILKGGDRVAIFPPIGGG
jgi:molybdopterin converting factor small subunit